MALLEEDVSKRAENVVANSTKSIDRLAEIDKTVAEQNAEINKFMQDIAQKLNDVSTDFRTNLDTFSNIVKDVREESNTATLTLLNNCENSNRPTPVLLMKPAAFRRRLTDRLRKLIKPLSKLRHRPIRCAKLSTIRKKA